SRRCRTGDLPRRPRPRPRAAASAPARAPVRPAPPVQRGRASALRPLRGSREGPSSEGITHFCAGSGNPIVHFRPFALHMSQPFACHPPARPHGPGFTRAGAGLTLLLVNEAAPASDPEPSDEALMLAYGGGDVAAFEALYGRHRLRLYRFLLRQLRDPALADELFQDVWQKLIAARASWTPEAAFATWLYRIAHNRLTDHWRALRHRPPAPADADERTARVPD